MPYQKPTLTELRDRIRNDIYSGLGIAVQFLRKGFIFVLSKTLAGQFNGAYGYLDWILDQLFPDTADEEFIRRWASIKKLTPIGSEKSKGSVDVIGAFGSTITAGTQLQRIDGVRFTVDVFTVLSSSPQSVAITSKLAGADTVTAAATALTFVSVPVGIDSEAIVDGSGITGGRDEETVAELLVRVLDSFRFPPRGGSAKDHDVWAKEALDATKTWVRNFQNDEISHSVEKCQVILYFAMHNTYTDGIPMAGDVTIVQDYIDERKPAGEDFIALAPTADPLDPDITIVPDNATTQAATTAQLQDLIKRETEENGTLLLSDIKEAIGKTPGLTDWTLNSPVADVTTAVGEIHTLGTPVYT